MLELTPVILAVPISIHPKSEIYAISWKQRCFFHVYFQPQIFTHCIGHIYNLQIANFIEQMLDFMYKYMY